MERRNFFSKYHYYDEIFDKYMTELWNLASTFGSPESHDNQMKYKTVDGIRLEKIGHALQRKGAKMTLEKAISKCCTNKITKNSGERDE